MVPIKERVVTFGPGDSLVGIETRPVEKNGAPPDGPPRPGVILLNAGAVHRVGPHRMSVNLARRFARAGHVAFRFDRAGVGDSRSRAGAGSDESIVIEDGRAAMDHLQQSTGVDRFVLGGLGSGADDSVRIALADPRVSAILLLDPYAYPTLGFYLRQYGPRGAQPPDWIGLGRRTAAALVAAARARLPRRFANGDARATDGAEGAEGAEVANRPTPSRHHPPRGQFAAQLRQLVARGVAIYIAYSGSRDAVYNYAEQFDDAFAPYGIGSADVSCTFLPRVNQTYTELEAQRRLGDTLVDWVATLESRATRN
jgi:hypothetical protein